MGEVTSLGIVHMWWAGGVGEEEEEEERGGGTGSELTAWTRRLRHSSRTFMSAGEMKNRLRCTICGHRREGERRRECLCHAVKNWWPRRKLGGERRERGGCPMLSLSRSC